MYDILAFNARKTQEKRKKNTNIYQKKVHFITLYPPQRHKNHAVKTSHTQYTASQKHPCHRCSALLLGKRKPPYA